MFLNERQISINTIEFIWFHTKIIISLQSELYLPIFVPYLKNYWKLIMVEDHQNDKTDLFSKVFWRIKGSVTKSSYIIHSRFLTLPFSSDIWAWKIDQRIYKVIPQMHFWTKGRKDRKQIFSAKGKISFNHCFSISRVAQDIKDEPV